MKKEPKTPVDAARDELHGIQEAAEKLARQASRGADLTPALATLRAVRMRLATLTRQLEVKD